MKWWIWLCKVVQGTNEEAYDQSILRRSFEPSQKVLYNSHLHLFPSKLKSRWTDAFIIQSVFTHKAIEIEDSKKDNTLKVNGQWLKLFLELKNSEIEMKLLADLSYLEWSSSVVESLAKDCKLSTCGRWPSFFLFPVIWFCLFVLFLFLFLLWFSGQVSYF
jgi:hypothetical protein